MRDEEKCIASGLDPKRVASIARRISKAMIEARSMRLILFGGSGTGMLRIVGGGAQNNVAVLDPCSSYEGGDGGDVH